MQRGPMEWILAGHATVESGAPCFRLEKTYSLLPTQVETQALLKAITLPTALARLKKDTQIVAHAINANREPPWAIKHLLQVFQVMVVNNESVNIIYLQSLTKIRI